MDKYNCWCKENSEGKATSVDAAEAQIKEMEGKVDALKATSAGLSTEIGNLGQEVESNEVSMDESEVMRNKQIEQFLQDESELENSVEEVQTARNVIAERHGDTSLLQTSQQQAIVQTVQRLLAKQSSHLRKDHSRKVAQLLQDPSSTVYVEEALTDLQTDFETGLADLKDQESTHKSDYEKMMLAMRSQIDAGRSQMAAKKEQMTAADEERAQTQQAIKDSRETMGEDIAFAKDVKEKCAKKAKEWENRQKTRADETQSVAKAIEVLSDDASHEVFGKTFSFLQVGTRDANARAARAAEMLTTVGKKLDQRLVTLGLEAKIDGFTKVKGKIDTLIANLKKEQVDEVKCKWQLRAAWLAQELLSTFEQDDILSEVSLVPSLKVSGVFEVTCDGRTVWSRKAEGRFPEAKELKQRVRDVLAPSKDLGHSDAKPPAAKKAKTDSPAPAQG